jgi:hypothetical protein
MGVAMPMKFRSPAGVLSFISTTTIFGSPLDVTLQEVALETFFHRMNSQGRHCGRWQRAYSLLQFEVHSGHDSIHWGTSI